MRIHEEAGRAQASIPGVRGGPFDAIPVAPYMRHDWPPIGDPGGPIYAVRGGPSYAIRVVPHMRSGWPHIPDPRWPSVSGPGGPL
jgi:hypothetical protein